MHTHRFLLLNLCFTKFSDFLIHHNLVLESFSHSFYFSLMFSVAVVFVAGENILIFPQKCSQQFTTQKEESFYKLSWLRIICNIGEMKFLSQICKFLLSFPQREPNNEVQQWLQQRCCGLEAIEAWTILNTKEKRRAIQLTKVRFQISFLCFCHFLFTQTTSAFPFYYEFFSRIIKMSRAHVYCDILSIESIEKSRKMSFHYVVIRMGHDLRAEKSWKLLKCSKSENLMA